MDKYISTNTSPFFAFNIWNIESAKAVMDGAFKMQRDVILQTSVKAFDFLDKSALRWFVDKYRREKAARKGCSRSAQKAACALFWLNFSLKSIIINKNLPENGRVRTGEFGK